MASSAETSLRVEVGSAGSWEGGVLGESAESAGAGGGRLMLGEGAGWSADSSRSSSTLPSAPPSAAPSSPAALSPFLSRGQGPPSQAPLECSLCSPPRTFRRHFVLSVHMRRHTGQRPYQCLVCGRAFASNFNVKRHLHSHRLWPHQAPAPFRDGRLQPLFPPPPPKPRPCPSSQSPDPSAPSTSATGPTGELAIPSPCPYCGEVYPGKPALEAHLVARHSDERKFQCPVRSCRRFFVQLSELLQHLDEPLPGSSPSDSPPSAPRKHGDERRFQCPFCSRTFDSLRDSGLHQHAHALVDRTREGDAEGGAAGGSREKAKAGAKGEGKSAVLECAGCGAVFRSAEALERHESTAHVGRASAECPVCGKTLASERLLRRHLRSHARDPAFACPDCAQAFPSTTALANHRRKHGDPSAHVCGLCPRAFGRAGDLGRHLASVHTSRPSFLCTAPACGRAFKRRDLLQAHAQRHRKAPPPQAASEGTAHGPSASTQQPHACPRCQRAFRRKDSLKRHTLTCKK